MAQATITIAMSAIFSFVFAGFIFSICFYLLLLLIVGNTNKKINSATLPTTCDVLSAEEVGTSPAFSANAFAEIIANNMVAIIDLVNAFIAFVFG